MELHRLLPMNDGYDKELFNRLYKETSDLRSYLTYQIDSRRYGVTPDIVKSWFDDKFIFVFNKYHNQLDNDLLKGYIINALKTFRFRVLRKAYGKYNIYNNEVALEGESHLINIIPIEEENTSHQIFLELALTYLKKNLCDDAFLVLELDLNPPSYITQKLITPKTKIPAKLIAEYLDLEINHDSITYINDLRKEASYWITQAREHFANSN